MTIAAQRYEYLDGLRGIAALQVVLLHYFSAFLPAMALVSASPWPSAPRWQVAFSHSPLFAAIDGYVAVNLFFLLSGFVLRGAFGRLTSLPAGVWRRSVRLGIPAVAASCLAVGVIALDASAHISAAQRSGSQAWLGTLITQPASLTLLPREALLNSMVLGYRNVSVFSKFLALPPLTSSFDPPIWTLHIEFIGSLLCLALSFLYRRSRLAAYAGSFLLVVIFVKSQLGLFIIGFWLTSLYPRRASKRSGQIFGAACGLSGIFLCRTVISSPMAWLFNWLHVFSPQGAFFFNNELAALSLLLALFTLPAMQSLLMAAPAQYLGRISFSLYLLHFPIMATFGCRIFFSVAPHVGIVGGTFAAFMVSMPITLAAAWAFTRLVDRPAVRLSHVRPNLHPPTRAG